ncbi:hypothetical protein GCM10022381_40600 [Leifsonia kafniensis]|uniref:GmrSD restriction endonucleases N-terminal domain-containing protein n=1 Tax=Leifsonia kafniensis TaxID=475957 RepID=A0ABP7L858_9MICO
MRGYPIGNLLLWRKNAEAAADLKIGALNIDAPAMEQALFVVDGQQRLTSLSNALTDGGHNDPRFALAYDVSKEQFVQSVGRSVYEIPLPVIFDLSRLLNWYRDHSELTDDPSYVDRANRVAKSIREFRVPVYIVDRSDPDVLRDIFDRMNNYGKQLTRAEVFSALHESGSGEKRAEGGLGDLSSISAEVHAATGYGLVDDDTILLAMLARRGADVSRDIRREFSSSASVSSSTRAPLDFPYESPVDARENATKALQSAISFLQVDAGAPHFAFLPYRYLLVVLTRFFAHFPNPDPAVRRNLRRWFWRAASLGPELTKGNITYATRSLCSRIKPGNEAESIEGLLRLVGNGPANVPDVKIFKTNYAATRLMVAAMWDLSPRRLSLMGAGESFSQEQLLAALGEGNTAVEISVPLYRTGDLDPADRALAANRVLLPDVGGGLPDSAVDVLRLVSRRAIEGDDSAIAVLDSHGVSIRSAEMLSHGADVEFIHARQIDLVKHLEVFLGKQTEWQFEDTPSLDSLNLDEYEVLDERDDPLWSYSNGA